MEFLARYSDEDVEDGEPFWRRSSTAIWKEQIETITGTQAEGMILCNRNEVSCYIKKNPAGRISCVTVV